MRNFLTMIIIVVLIFIVSACQEADNSNEDSTEDVVVSVESMVVETGDFVVEKSVYGHVGLMDYTPIMIEQPGELTTLKVENGEAVKKDDHIATVKTPMGNQSIYAPEDGEIAQLTVKEEAFVSNEDPLALVVNLDELEATFQVTPTTREFFESGDEVEVLIDGNVYKTVISPLDPMPNETGQYEIVVELDNKERDILLGDVAQLLIKDVRVKDAIIVPTAAILTEDEVSYIYTLEDNVAKRIDVDIVELQSGEAAVTGELSEDAEIIVKGQFTLSDGSKVEVVKEGN